MASETYRVVRAFARAPRPVVSYEAVGDWVPAALDVVQWLSERWGGAAGLIAPVAEAPDLVNGHLLRLLAVCDPDVVVHRPVFLRDLDDAGAREALAAGGYSGEITDERLAQARADLHDTPVGPDLGAQAAAIIGRWCAPRHPWEEPSSGAISAPLWFSHSCEEPFTPTPVVTGPRAPAVSFNIDALDPMFKLLVATRAGVSPEGRTEALIEPSEEDLPGLAEWAMTGSLSYGSMPCVDEIVASSGTGVTAEQIYERLPLPTTQWGLDWVHLPTVRCDVVVVIGDTPADHALAVAADHLATTGAWLPARFLRSDDAYTAAAHRGLAATLMRSRMGGKAARRTVTSVSLSVEEVSELLAGLPGPPSEVDVVPPGELDLRDRWVLGDLASISHQSSHPVSTAGGGVAVLTSLDPPIPKALEAARDGSWFIDVTIDGAPLPPVRSALSADMLLASPPSAGVDATLVRPSNGGLSFWSHGAGLVLAGSPWETTFARPLLRLPSASEIVAALARAAGLRAETSTPGRRAGRVADMWGGHECLAAALRGPTRDLLDGFLPATRSGPYEHGCAVGDRGFVAFPAAQRLLGGSTEAARAVLDDLLSRRVLRRGLLLGCERCDHLHFYGTEEFAQTFNCKSCTAASALTLDRWRHPADEPQWYYALDPLVADLLTQNGDVPVLAAHEILSRTSRPGAATFETEFYSDDSRRPLIEIDFACVTEGKLYLGEAKSNGRLQVRGRNLEQSAQRFADIAVRLQADSVVLASSSKDWSPATASALASALDAAARRSGAPVPRSECIVLA